MRKVLNSIALASICVFSGCAARVVDPNTGRKVYSSTDHKVDANAPIHEYHVMEYEGRMVELDCVRSQKDGTTICNVR